MNDSAWISASWLARSSLAVAPDLIGCTLARQLASGPIYRGLIVETEAYMAGDPACHGYRKQTRRNAPMFGKAGHAYIYLIYGMYHCFNVVTDREGLASAVLIRAILPPTSLPPRPKDLKGKPERYGAGPGKLCRLFHIDRTLSGLPLQPRSGLWLEPRSPDFAQKLTQGGHQIIQTTRIGLSQGQDLPWRWYLNHCQAVSIARKSNQNMG
ncbi:DNA-3-methyladenine glycosylase [Lyngbya confervoides]|uniref:Putative 3-methyladenine DNA glycosylase n=1 Tax=Lyngbya confervoides BDU141951 TaxID=1574623 RepID=A0ABD4T2Y3_9CYAN|nr:DNA-3-methyladenine glycosylase [Lyngbya confervoides]MCM1983121.1 DNA-3-methyladenine glycosylase [Lyngbya confervoides BDU141951]